MTITIRDLDDTFECFDTAKEALKFLKDQVKAQKEASGTTKEKSLEKATFYHIGGYELLRDGTKKDKVKGIDQLKEFLDEIGIEYDASITDFRALITIIEPIWEYMYDDGGGSGWIEY